VSHTSLANPVATRILSSLALGSLLVACGCGDDPAPKPKDGAEPASEAAEAKKPESVDPVSPDSAIVPPPAAQHAQSLDALLDMVPAEGDTYLVIRDLQPLVARGREIEGVVSGPLTGLTKAFAGVDENVDESGMAALGKTLQEMLAGIDAAGLKLDQGLVLASISLEGMPALIEAFGAAGEDSKTMPAENCAPLPGKSGWFGCSEGGKTIVEKYKAGGAAAKHRAALVAALPGTDLDSANAAFSTDDGVEEAHAALSTNPGLWHLSVSLPPEQLSLFKKGDAKALRSAEPGDSFVWATLDLSDLPQQLIPPQMTELVASLDGEAYLGIDHAAEGDEVGVMLQVGLSDPGPARGGLAFAATQLEGLPTAVPGAPDTKLVWGTEIVTHGEEKLALLTLKGEGGSAKTFSTALDLPPQGTAFGTQDYLTVVAGEDKSVIPAHLAQTGSGASTELLRSLPAPLAQAIIAKEASAIYHFEADGLQVPFDDEVLEYGLVGVPEDKRPPADVLRPLYAFLAPYSSLSVWLSHLESSPQVHIALRDFSHDADAEGKAAAAALARVAAGEDGLAVYGELADARSTSPRAAAYAARAGRSDRTNSAMGLMTTGVLVNLLTSAVANYQMQSAMQQMPPPTMNPNAGLGGMGAPPPGSLQLTPPGRGL
jgi:hypothetical protein